MRSGADLGGKSKVGRRRILIPDDDPYFVGDSFFTDTLQKWTGKAVGDDRRPVSGQELGDLADAVTDDILKQGPGELSYPMIPVAQKRLGIARIGKFIAVLALHVHGLPAQVATFDQLLILTMAWVN